MGLRKALLLLSIAYVVIAVLAAQTPSDPDWQIAAGGKMAFEVASVKLAKPGTFAPPTFFLDLGDAKPRGGRFSYSFPIWGYIGFAYKIDLLPSQEMLAPHLPKWANENYVIDAKADGNPTKDQWRLMMQSLLADRFKLKVHFESRERPVLALTLVKPGKLGPKLRPHSEGPPCPDSFEMINPSTTPLPKESDVWPPQCGTSALFAATPNVTRIGARNTTMELLAQDIYHYGSRFGGLDKPVVDRTALQGKFDFILELPPGMLSFSLKPPDPDDPPPEPKGPPFLNAVREQLGLKLVRSRGEIRMLIIDHVERPSEN